MRAPSVCVCLSGDDLVLLMLMRFLPLIFLALLLDGGMVGKKQRDLCRQQKGVSLNQSLYFLLLMCVHVHVHNTNNSTGRKKRHPTHKLYTHVKELNQRRHEIVHFLRHHLFLDPWHAREQFRPLLPLHVCVSLFGHHHHVGHTQQQSHYNCC